MIRIETGRLVLRTPGETDLPAYLAYRNEFEAVRTQKLQPIGAEAARAFLRTQAELPDAASGWRMLGIEWADRPADGLLGEVGVFLEADRPEGNVGWWLHSRVRGQGVATEAARGLIGWCFTTLALHRVTAGCLSDNAGSLRVMQRLRMRLEKRSMESRRLGDAWYDEVECAILRREWRGRP